MFGWLVILMISCCKWVVRQLIDW